MNNDLDLMDYIDKNDLDNQFSEEEMEEREHFEGSYSLWLDSYRI